MVLTSVGIDIGSATTHLAFSRLRLHRLGERLSTRYVVVERTILHESAIAFTPYRPDGLIDAHVVGRLVADAYAQAGIGTDAIDTGALVLTGEAVKRANARAIAERLALLAGRFVSATAGPMLEATMAAHGSGSVALSKTAAGDVLNVDIGGGSTKFSVARDGRIVATAALAVGGRLVAVEGTTVVRLETAVLPLARSLGLDLADRGELTTADRERLGLAMADLVTDVVAGRQIDAGLSSLWVTEPLVLERTPVGVTVSGGVGEYVRQPNGRDLGDLGSAFGRGVRAAFESDRIPPFLPTLEAPIRATVIGASQFTVQVSGSTLFRSPQASLPLRDLPVLRPSSAQEDADVLAAPTEGDAIAAAFRRVGITEGDRPVALAFHWTVPPVHRELAAFCRRLEASLPRTRAGRVPLVLIFDADVASSIGHVLTDELAWPGAVVSLDSIDVREFDHLDVGAPLQPLGVIPVVVKSLVFPWDHVER